MSIATILDLATEINGDRAALGRRAEALTVKQLSELASRGAAVLADANHGSVAFVGISGPAFPAALFAAARAGIPFAPLNYRLSTDQLRTQVEQLDAPFVIGDPAVLDGAATPEQWLETCRDPGADALDEPVVADGDAPAVLLFTSGTTAAPKCAVLTHDNLLAYVLQTVEMGAAGEAEAALVSVPPYHVAGIGTVLTNLHMGRRLVFLPDFSPAHWVETVQTEGVSFAMVVPTMLARLTDHLGTLKDPASALRSLRAIAYGGAKTPRTVLEKALALFGDVAFTNAYGLTETSSTIAVLGPHDHRAAAAGDATALRRLDSVGTLVPGIEGTIRDAHDREVDEGDEGRLWVRGPQVSGRYTGHGSLLDADGWFDTRDLAYIDHEGYVFVVGRDDDTIIRGGENLSPVEIEETIRQHPQVADVGVTGLPDEEWGARIAAAVVPFAGEELDPDSLREFVRSRLRGSKTPSDVVVVAELPYTPTGKLLRRELPALMRATPPRTSERED